LHTFLDSANVYPESVTVDQSSGSFFVGSVKEGMIYKGKVATARLEVFSPGGHFLIIGKRNENMLFRVDLKSREILPVNMPAGMLNTPDGLFLQGNTLYVAQNLPKSITVVKLSSDFSHAELERAPHVRVPNLGGAL
jgi:hypothetical protein